MSLPLCVAQLTFTAAPCVVNRQGDVQPFRCHTQFSNLRRDAAGNRVLSKRRGLHSPVLSPPMEEA